MAQYLRLFPPHRHFVDVFGGSGAVILNKPPSQVETFNDVDRHIFNLFTLLQDDSLRARLIERLELTHGANYDFFVEAINTLKQPSPTPLDAAWAFLVASWQSKSQINPALLHDSDWRISGENSKVNRRFIGLPKVIEFVARRFKYVEIAHWDWRRVISQFDSPSTFGFYDPPYFPTANKRKYYAAQMSEGDHTELLETLQHVKGYALLCGYSSPLYERHLAHWRRLEFPVKAVATVSGTKPDRIEIVWLNYNPDGSKSERIGK